MAVKVTYNDIKKLEHKLKELEDEIKELFNAPFHRKSYHVRVIREIQNMVEQRIQEFTSKVGQMPTSVKFPFENFVYVYRAKEGYFENQINQALYRPPGSFAVDENSGKVVETGKSVAEKVISRSKADPLDSKLDSVLSQVVRDETKRALLKQSVKEQIEAAKQKAGKDYKVTVQVGKNDSGKPAIKVKLVKK